MDVHDGFPSNANPTPPELNRTDAVPGSSGPPPLNGPEIRALRDFFYSTGGSVLFCLSAVSIFAGLSSIVGPVLGTATSLSSTLPAIGAIGLYELCLFALLVALVLRWSIMRDTVSLLVLVAVFLITLGMLVSTVANDAPRVVLGVGVAVVGVAVGESLLIRRVVHVPINAYSLIAIGSLLAWNSLTSALIADYIGADVTTARAALDVWPIAAWIPVIAVLMFYVDASTTATGSLIRMQQGSPFLRSPGMAWVFIGTLVTGTVIHVYAMRYVFDLPFYFVDYLPILGVASFTAVEIARGYGAMTRPANYAAAMVPLGALVAAILGGSYDESSGLGAGTIADADVIAVGLGALAVLAAMRHRTIEFVLMSLAYLFVGLVLGMPATSAEGRESIDWNTVAGGATALACVFLLMHRNPMLWIAALVAAVAFLPLVEPARQWFESGQLTEGDRAALRGVIFGAGLVAIGCLFAKRVHLAVLLAGDAILVVSVLKFSGFAQHPEAMFAAGAVALLGAASYWCTRRWVAALPLAIPAARIAYLGVGDAGGWRFIALGFALLVGGAIWSVLNRSGEVPGPAVDKSNPG